MLACGCSDPAVEQSTRHREPVVTSRDGIRIVHNYPAAERFLPRPGIPRHATMLFAGIVGAAHRPDGVQAVLSLDGRRLLQFDPDGRFERALGDTLLRRAVGVDASADGWIIVERDGDATLLRLDGSPRASFQSPFGTSLLASSGDGYVASRSPFAVPVRPLPPHSPLLEEIGPGGQLRATIDTVITPASVEATFLANAGPVAARDSLVFFALFARDEIRAYDRRGRPRWVSDRMLDWATEPHVERTAAGPELRYQTVNLGMTVTSAGLYVLSYADTSQLRLRLDLLDPETGVLIRTADLSRRPSLISLDEGGALWIAPADTLARLGEPPARSRLLPFRLATFAGDSFDLATVRGKVTLVNFWASWCDPCRDEFPLMNQLARERRGQDFAIVAVNEDVDRSAARRFLKEFPADFVVPMGDGRMQSMLGFRGLPFTLLLDRQGRIVERYPGFGGAAQFQQLRRRIDRLLAEPGPASGG